MPSPQVPLDPVALAQALIRRPSITPADAGALSVIEEVLRTLGFTCRRMRFGQIENLYARRGTRSPNLCFAGHTDVVPAGDAASWRHDPFAGQVLDGVLHGRGAVDMKGAIAAFIAAIPPPGGSKGSLSLLITGDEEGLAVDGTRRVVDALMAEGERIDHCVVGEPSSSVKLGDMIKVGRRGNLNAWIKIEGTQGHVAYPDRAANPAPVLIRLLARLVQHRLDEGYPEFQPSNLEVTALAADDVANNVIPATASARLNIRFNPAHTGAALVRWLATECKAAGRRFPGTVGLRTVIKGEPFLTPPEGFAHMVASIVEATLGTRPELSTSGGTSDARYIRAMCPVIEVGLVGSTMHKVDECTPVAEIAALTRLYAVMIERYFETFG